MSPPAVLTAFNPITFPSHAPGYQQNCVEDIDVPLASILYPPIRVKNQIMGNGALPDSHQPGRDNGLYPRIKLPYLWNEDESNYYSRVGDGYYLYGALLLKFKHLKALDPLNISTAQFENRSGDKSYNLSVIEELAQKASREGSDIIAFHEYSVTGYTFAMHLTEEQMPDLAEIIPGGETMANEMVAGKSIRQCRLFEDSYITSAVIPEKLSLAGGYRYKKARRTALYRYIIRQSHHSELGVAWLGNAEK